MNALRTRTKTVRWLAVSVASVVTCTVLMLGNVKADQAMSNLGIASDSPISKFLFAHRLASYGRKNHEPLALMLAAKLVKDVDFAAAEPLPDKKEKSTDVTPANPPLNADELLRDAKRLAGERQDILALISDIQHLGTRTVLGNIGLLQGSLSPGKSVVYRFSFEGGSDASVAILPSDANAEDSVDFDLIVSDANGRTICKGLDRGLPDPCGWSPAKTGTFSVKIKNRGQREAAFTLLVS